MRQVPKYLIIGSGRMARHFSYYLQLLQLPYQQWSRAHNTPDELKLMAESCTHVLILINDSAIEEFINNHPYLKSKCCVHFSGCLVTKAAASAHPFMTFSTELYDLDTYSEIPFTLEQEGPDLDVLLPGLPNPSFKIPQQQKPLYHALGVIGNNFTTLLWQKVFQVFQEKLDLPREIAYPMLKRTLMNLMDHPDAALTGPLVRGDEKTIQAHLKALAGDPFYDIYQAFVKTYQKYQHEENN